MTKEEIVDKIAMETDLDFHNIYMRAMDEWAIIKSIGFAEWKEKNNWWSDTDDGEKGV